MNDLGVFLMLLLRGFLLWVVIPVAAVSWVVLGPITTAPLGACIGWFDLNLMALLTRILLRPLVRHSRFPWVPLGKMRNTDHRVGFLLDTY